MLLQKFFHPIVCAAREGRVSEQPKMIMRQLLHIIIQTNNFRLTYYCFFFTPFFSSFRPNVKTTSALWPKCLKKSSYYAEPTLTSQSVAITHSRYDKQFDTMRPKKAKISKMCHLCSQKIRESPFLLTFVIKKGLI